MDESKNSRIRYGRDLTMAERHQMIQEYLAGGITKQDIWYKYTGQLEEHGSLLRWMRLYGYLGDEKKRRPIFNSSVNYHKMDKADNMDKPELLARIKQLEKELQESKLREEGYRMMIDIAEESFKIPIRKKSDTK